ncbi:MAG: tRNA (guanosine(37)-N1)-methyltransferase TrmD [Oligoflexales bacterium]
MKISFVSIHPQFIEAYFGFGVMRTAVDSGIVELQAVNLRDFAVDRHGTIDDRPFGGGDGMVFKPEPLAAAMNVLKPDRVVLLSPAGQLWSQKSAESMSSFEGHVVFICGRFGGVDQRFIDKYVDLEVSIGDVILSGGELPALCLADSILRLLPGVLGHPESATYDSFSQAIDGCLESPMYTRPREFEGDAVPDVLLSGHDLKITEWRQEQSRLRTQKRRPDLLKK